MAVHVEFNGYIDRPIEEVWEYIHDYGRIADWQEGVIEAWSDGAPGLDATVNFKRRFMGREVDSQTQIIVWEPPYRSVNSIERPFTGEITQMLEELNGGTNLTIVADLEPGGFFGAIATPLLQNQLKKNLEADFGRLKAILEG
jgi:carbon monoxide dehydrogenase subunit G